MYIQALEYYNEFYKDVQGYKVGKEFSDIKLSEISNSLMVGCSKINKHNATVNLSCSNRVLCISIHSY